jgi:hypothetical protein
MKFLSFFMLFIMALKLSTGLSFFQPDNLSSRIDKLNKVSLPKGKFFLIQNNLSGKCLDSTSEDVKLITCDKLNANQKWKIQINSKKDNPWMVITNSLGKRLNNKNSSKEKGNKFSANEINWTSAQSFKIEKDDDDSIFINEESKLCLDLQDDNLVQEECNRNNSQKWTLIRIKIPSPKPVNNDDSKNNGNKKDNVAVDGKEQSANPGIRNRVSGKGSENSKNSQKSHKRRFSGYYQIRNSDGKCVEDTMTDQKMRFGSCNVYEDGFYFKFTRNKKDKAFYISSALGNVINYQDGNLVSKIFKEGEKQTFKIKASQNEGLYKIKSLDKTCLTNQQGNLILSPCQKEDGTQFFELFSYKRIHKIK